MIYITYKQTYVFCTQNTLNQGRHKKQLQVVVLKSENVKM